MGRRHTVSHLEMTVEIGLAAGVELIVLADVINDR
jgi:hypothetical protein